MIRMKLPTRHEYPLLLFGLAAVGFALARLLALHNPWADTFAAMLLFLTAVVVVLAITHYWRWHAK